MEKTERRNGPWPVICCAAIRFPTNHACDSRPPIETKRRFQSKEKMRRAALAILFVLLFVTQKAAQDDDRADTTFNLGKSWLLGLSGVLVGHFIYGMG
jgi:hypothetical protein